MSLLKSCGYFYKHGAPGALVENAGEGEGRRETRSRFRNCIHFSHSVTAKCTYASSLSSHMQCIVNWHRNSSRRRSEGLSVSAMLGPSYALSSSLYLLTHCHPAPVTLFCMLSESKIKTELDLVPANAIVPYFKDLCSSVSNSFFFFFLLVPKLAANLIRRALFHNI